MSLENKTKTISMTANCVIKDVTVASFYATIDSEKLEDMVPGRSIIDNEAYKANRAAVMSDQAAFEDEAYAFLEELKGQK